MTEANMETVLGSCGFGVFSLFIFGAIFPGFTAMFFAIFTISYILPSAECDLQLSLFMKGVLNGMVYAGMILSAIPWGFAADIFGRKPVLVFGHLFDFIFVFCAGFSQNYVQLCILKFLNGFCICGPFSTALSYAAELHSIKHRPVVMMICGIMIALCTLILPVIANFLLPNAPSYYGPNIELHNWNYFILVTSSASLLATLFFLMLPESPKFLMSKGRGEEALKVLARVYACNKCKPKSDFPYSKLEDEFPEKTARNKKYIEEKTNCCIRTRDHFLDGVKDMKALCLKVNYVRLVKACFLQALIILPVNSVSLWVPSIFATTATLKQQGSKDVSMCRILSYYATQASPLTRGSAYCRRGTRSATFYVTTIIVNAAVFVGHFIMAILSPYISTYIISIVTMCGAILCTILLYFSMETIMIICVAPFFITFCGVALTTVITLVVQHFPTSVRTMAILIMMTAGRIGGLIGNLLLPYLFRLGCLPTFVVIALCLIAALGLFISLRWRPQSITK